MILKMPSYCEKFRCSADKCSDNCCIGWEIDIDEDTFDIYKNISGDFGERLKNNICVSECPSFVLNDERCPFLNRKNLCDIIINLGEDRLCNICRDHPRYFEWYGGIKEGGVGLCCEEGAKLILTSENPLLFTEREVSYENGEECDEEFFRCLYEAREKIFSVISDESRSMKDRVADILCFTERMQMNIDNFIYTLPEEKLSFDGIRKGNMKALLQYIRETEPIDGKWESFINELIDNYKNVPVSKDFMGYQKNLMIYFIYRYFLKGVFDGEILSKVKFALVSVAVITYIIEKKKEEKGSITFTEIIDICKLWSKQMEYSQENIDLMADFSYSEDCFCSESIISYFEGEK